MANEESVSGSATSTCELCEPKPIVLAWWIRYPGALAVLAVVELLMFSAGDSLPLWLLSVMAAEVAVLIGLAAVKFKVVPLESLARPDVTDSDPEIASNVALAHSSTADHALLAWTGLLATVHAIVLAGVVAVVKSADWSDDLQPPLIFTALALTLLAALCGIANSRLSLAADRAWRAVHFALHQPNLAGLFGYVHHKPRDQSGFAWASSIFHALLVLWSILAWTLLVLGIVAGFLA